MSSQSEVPVPNPPLCAEGVEVLDGSTPWLNPAQMPEKPGGFLYGVRFKNHPKFGNQDHPCGTEPELIATLQQHPGHIDVVYLPDQDKGVPRLSLSRYVPFQKQDLRKIFLKSIPTKGGLGLAAIAAAVYMGGRGMGMMLFFAGLMFGIMPIFDSLIQWLIYPRNKPLSELKKSMVHGSAFFDWVDQGKRSKLLMWLTLAIIAVVYWGQMKDPAFDGISNLGKIQKDLVMKDGEWWRLFTGTLMHSPQMLLHILMNSMGFYYIGKFIHRLTLPIMVIIVFVVSAFTGAIASTVFGGPLGSVGASGGVVGMLGFITFLALHRRNSLPYDFRSFAIRNLFIITVIGVLAEVGSLPIDNAGHAGGFLGGLLCGFVYDASYKGRWDIPNNPIFSILGILSGALLLFGFACCLDIFYFDSQYLIPKLPRYSW